MSLMSYNHQLLLQASKIQVIIINVKLKLLLDRDDISLSY